jgi:hypothetical protein
MSLLVKIQSLIKRTVVDLPSATPQLQHNDDSLIPGVEHMEPQGLHFIAPQGAQGLILCPAAQTSNAVAVGLQGQVPSGTIQPGEGGLHYLGEWKVFLAADGSVSFGQQDASDFVALASLVLNELNQVKSDLTAFKTVFDAHTHITTATIGLGPLVGVNAPPAAPFPPPHSPASVASSVLKAE